MIAVSAVRTHYWPHRLVLWLALTALLSCALLASRIPDFAGGSKSEVTVMLPPASAPLAPPNLLRPVSPQDALEENSQRAFSSRPDSSPAPFRFAGDAASEARALNCLTQAVYYEAAGEGVAGERAVAQVVLNRVRHPGYPPSVCGVVYEKSEGATGCQFTFTCDGSLARVPVPGLWKQAQQIADQALNGLVFAPVGHATHYHADYVLPYWADSLDKSVQIGHHIFYRLKGYLGDASAFSQSYARQEPLPPSPVSTADAVETATDTTLTPVNTDQAAAMAAAVTTGLTKSSDLKADSTGSVLLADAGAAPAATGVRPSQTKTEVCPAADTKRLRPLSPNDVRSSNLGDCSH